MGKIVSFKLWSVLNYFITLATGYCYFDFAKSFSFYSGLNIGKLSIGTSLVVFASLIYWTARTIIMIFNYKADKIERRENEIKKTIEHEAILRKIEEERRKNLDVLDLGTELDTLREKTKQKK